MVNIIRNDISERYNVDSNRLNASDNYVRNLARNVTRGLYVDIRDNLKTCLRGECRAIGFETSVNIKDKQNNDNFFLQSYFVYRITVTDKEKVITFHNLKMAATLRGRGVLTGVLRQLEAFCDTNGVTIEITELGNLQLAFYLGTKRGYDLYSGVRGSEKRLNRATLNRLEPMVKAHTMARSFPARLKIVREMGKNKPEFAVRKPRK
jgi:hypothetical protein